MNKYEYKKSESDAPTVEVTVPSGNVFLFRKPSKFALMFNLKNMPASLTEVAIEKWKDQGIGSETQIVEEAMQTATKEDRMQMFQANMKIRDKVLDLSVKPKLVLDPTETNGELCVDDVTDEDLDYLFQWVAAGGVAPKLSTFPRRPEQSSLASASRKTRKPKAVAAGGTQ